MHGQFKRETEELSSESWSWIRIGGLKKETEGLIFAAQDQAIRTNVMKPRLRNRTFQQRVECVETMMKQFSISYVVVPSLPKYSIKFKEA